jgi:hypothetical protein
LCLALLCGGIGPTACDDKKEHCIVNEAQRRAEKPAVPPPIELGRVDQIPPQTLTVAETRKKLAHRGTLTVAAAMLQDAKRAITCLQKQHVHKKSCPPPYFIFGDAPPFAKKPARIGQRMLVKMHPVPKGLKTGQMYLLLGYWCPSGHVAKFCPRQIHRIPQKQAQRFYQSRVRPHLPPPPKNRKSAPRKDNPPQNQKSAPRKDNPPQNQK